MHLQIECFSPPFLVNKLNLAENYAHFLVVRSTFNSPIPLPRSLSKWNVSLLLGMLRNLLCSFTTSELAVFPRNFLKAN